MFEELIEECYAHLKSRDPGDGKTFFGYIWAVFASKSVCFRNETISLSWRELSARLARIYNGWYQQRFTTDAFLNVCSADTEVGENAMFDSMLRCVYEHKDCSGIFKTTNGVSAAARNEFATYVEADVVTGEERFYQQKYTHGRPDGEPTPITREEFAQMGLKGR